MVKLDAGLIISANFNIAGVYFSSVILIIFCTDLGISSDSILTNLNWRVTISAGDGMREGW